MGSYLSHEQHLTDGDDGSGLTDGLTAVEYHDTYDGTFIPSRNKEYADIIYTHFLQFLQDHCDTIDPTNYVSYVEFTSAFFEYMRHYCNGHHTNDVKDLLDIFNYNAHDMKELLDALIKKLNDDGTRGKICVKGFTVAREFLFYKGVTVKSFP